MIIHRSALHNHEPCEEIAIALRPLIKSSVKALKGQKRPEGGDGLKNHA